MEDRCWNLAGPHLPIVVASGYDVSPFLSHTDRALGQGRAREAMEPQEPGFFAALIKDGRPLLSWTALALLFSGGFALFLSASGQFLPHDMAFLGVSAEALRGVAGGRVVSFM